MTIRVKLPNGKYGKFPDGTSHEEIESVLQKQFPHTGNQSESKLAPTPFNPQHKEGNNSATVENEDDEFPIPESTGLSAVEADLLSSALSAKDFVGDIPDKLEKSGKYIDEHPVSSIFHNAGQLAAETGDIGKGFINAPYNLNQYLARKHLLPQVLGKLGKLIPHLPDDTGIENTLGLEQDKEKGDDLIRAIPDLASALMGVKSLATPGKKLFKPPNLKQALRDTQAKVNATDANLGKAFDTVESEVEKRGLRKIPVNKAILDNAEKFLDKTPESKELIKRAKSGEYKALRELQADLRQVGETALSNKLTTERKVGKEAFSTRKQINQSIEKHFDSTGHKDLAELLKTTKTGYKNMQDTYFSTPALARVFGKSQKLPKNPLTLLTEESTEMKRFFSAHPEVKTLLEKALKHGSRKKIALRIGTALGSGATGGATYKILGGH